MTTRVKERNSLARQALASAELLVPTWLPDGERQGDEWVARNPKRSDRSAGSFKINVEKGARSDFATGDAGVDLISLYAYLNDKTAT